VGVNESREDRRQESSQRETVERIVAEVMKRLKGRVSSKPEEGSMTPRVIGAGEIRIAASEGGPVMFREGDFLTPLAGETAVKLGVTIQADMTRFPRSGLPDAIKFGDKRLVVLGSDHGGFRYKKKGCGIFDRSKLGVRGRGYK